MKPGERYALLALSAPFLVYLILEIKKPGLASIMLLSVPFLATAVSWIAKDKVQSPESLFWRRFSLGSLCWGVGRGVSMLKDTPSVPIEEAAYLAYVSLHLWGLWTLYPLADRYAKLKRSLDFVLLAAASLLVAWPLSRAFPGKPMATSRILLPIYQVGDLLLLFSSILIYQDKEVRVNGWSLRYLGVLSLALGNLLEGLGISGNRPWLVELSHLGWMAAFLMFSGAALCRLKNATTTKPATGILHLYLPSVLLVFIPLVVTYSIIKGGDDHLLQVFSVSVILLAIFRSLLIERDLEIRIRDQERNNHNLSFLNTMADALGGALDIPGIFDRLLEKTSERIPVDAAGIFLIDRHTQDLELFLSRGLSEGFAQALRSERLRLGEGLSGRVAQSGKPYVSANIQQDPLTSPDRKGLLEHEGIQGYIGIPLLAWGEVIGVVWFFSRTVYSLQQEEVELLVSVCKQVAVAIESRRIDADKERRSREALALFQFGQTISSTIEFREVLEKVLDLLSEIFGARSAWVMLYSGEKDLLELAALRGWQDEEGAAARMAFRPGEGVTGEVFKRRIPIFVPDVQEDLRFILKGAAAQSGIRSMIGIPLMVKGKVIGVIGLYAPSLVRGTDIEQDRMELLLTFASQAAIAIENAGLYRDLAGKVRELESLQRHLVQTEKLSAIEELVSGVAHELNNPLTSVIGYAQLMMNSVENPQHKEYLDTIFKEAMSCSEIIRNLLTFARHHKPQRDLEDVNAVLERALELKGYQIETDGIRVVEDFSPDLPRCWIDVHQMQQVFFSIIHNAHQALLTPRDNPARPVLTVRSRQSGSRVILSFEDNGPGIFPEVLPRIFEPFFTTKEVGVGTGLGLSISYGIVKEHGGEIRVDTEVGRGSCFSVLLPAIAEEPARPASSEGDLRGKVVLVIDSSEVILEMCAYVLRSQGITVHPVRSAAAAFEKILANADYDLIFAAVPLPDMNLSDFYERLDQEFPLLPERLLFSVSEETLAKDPSPEGIFQRSGRVPLERPFTIAEFRRAVEVALTSWRTLS